MKKVLIGIMVLGMLVSCTRVVVLEVGSQYRDGKFENYRVVYTRHQTGSQWTSTDNFLTSEGVDAFIDEANENLSEWK